MAKVFSVLPEDFFVPLASPNRFDYVASLLIFYQLFQETPRGVERSALVARLAEYVAETGHRIEDEEDGSKIDEPAEDSESSGTEYDADRAEASRIIRRLIHYGWLGEETQKDYSRLILMKGYAKPFFDALSTTESGSSLEYESHIVAIYSSLCTDAAKDYGHHAVLNAHYHLSQLIDSLKVLSQNIRTHYERLLEESADSEVADILRLHYDRYLEEVVDRAYARLKTSDNLSKYRPRIIRTVNSFLQDKTWLQKTAAALAMLRREPVEEGRKRLVLLLEEIRDQLRALDPTLDEIDQRNMLYARSSLERIRSRLRSDATLGGRMIEILNAVSQKPELARRLPHRLYRVRWIGRESRYNRWLREKSAPVMDTSPVTNTAEMERAEAELRLRIQRQLSPERIAAWLQTQMGDREFRWAHEVAADPESFVRMLHATLYGEGRRNRFPFQVEWKQDELVQAAGWQFIKHGYRRRR